MSPATSSAEATGTLKKGLHQEGRRMTPQRRLVLDLFEQIGSGSHLSAEEVHRQLVDNQSKVSLATIYRTLRLLVEMDFLQELELRDGGSRFELADEEHIHHHHLVCVRCGRTEEFENEPVLQAGRDACKQFDFELIDSSLNVRGICQECR